VALAARADVEDFDFGVHVQDPDREDHVAQSGNACARARRPRIREERRRRAESGGRGDDKMS
jgi:hypothetical protein